MKISAFRPQKIRSIVLL